MARKKREEEHENHERWLVSYADFITLLFAFFVVMYAISQVNEGKYKILADSLINAFGKEPVSTAPIVVQAGGQGTQQSVAPKITLQKPRSNEALRREKERMTDMARDILQVLAPLVQEGKVRVTQTSVGVNVEINANVLFAPGDAKVSRESEETLIAIARVLKNDDHAIQIEGHTDNTQINTSVFPSNWELSAVRASTVARLFNNQGIADLRLTAVGHGSNQAVASNDTPEGRLRNRRVDVMILSRLAEQATEVPFAEEGGKVAQPIQPVHPKPAP
ncbi:flagellar motor protein MotD [Herbaspirillum lusitanum]|uniref:flagellar motor protein MotD n=1 Tax=Herbaspirillum lusitanum TaxID=213312 RepID=UPI0003004CE9|nr:flagellar motor protein MotD [Herbaspirillum lusitanum]MCW5298314.1 flagellar motor protein MotD [Herbaspirillum lusitanum]